MTVNEPGVSCRKLVWSTLVIPGATSARATSTAPMVHAAAPAAGRVVPLWSRAPFPHTFVPLTLVGSGTTPAAGLFVGGSIVSVGPPLSASAPRSGSALTTSLAWVKPRVAPLASSVRLKPALVSVPPQFGNDAPLIGGHDGVAQSHRSGGVEDASARSAERRIAGNG